MTVNNIITILGVLLIVLVAAFAIYKFVKMPFETKKQNLKEWLKWAVVEAEKALQSGTGKIKLRLCYSWCITQFPWVAKFVSFETFSLWVDDALDWMRKELENNKALRDYVGSDK